MSFESVIFNTHDVVLLMTAYQCILYAILLVALSGESGEHLLRNLFLVLFLLSCAAIPMDLLINFGAEFRNVALETSPNLFYIFGFAYWLDGPLLLWYTRSVLYKNYRPKKHEWLYLLPFIAYLCYEILFYYSLSPEAKLALQQGYDLATAPKYMNYVTFFREVFRFAFGVTCLIEIRRYRATIRDTFSDVQAIDFRWLNLLVIGFLLLRVLNVIMAVMLLATIHFGFSANFGSVGLAGNYLTFFLISMLIFFSLKHSSVVGGMEEQAKANAWEKERFDEVHIQKLLGHMEQEKPYLQHSLTIDHLAEQVGMSTRLLSSIMNRHFNRNFFEFINQYRIEEAKRLLAQQGMNVLDILYAAGFNSKSTFNMLFKKSVGMPPSDYRKKVRAESQILEAHLP